MNCGWKAYGEISYGGYGCLTRAKAADFLVRSWMEESCPGVKDDIVSYIIGYDSLKVASFDDLTSAAAERILDLRLRMDGLFNLEDHAIRLADEFTALYTNGPAGGGGIRTGHCKEVILQKVMVEREHVYWQTKLRRNETTSPNSRCASSRESAPASASSRAEHLHLHTEPYPAPSGKRIPLYQVAHSRAGDKGNDLNFSIVPHFPGDVERLKTVITANWVMDAVSPLLDSATAETSQEAMERRKGNLEQVKVEIYEARGIHSLNVVVRNILDGGVNASRRIDRHGKTISDLILCKYVVLPP